MNDIKMAQVEAGEEAVIERLRAKGLLPPGDRIPLQASTVSGGEGVVFGHSMPERIWLVCTDRQSGIDPSWYREMGNVHTDVEYVRADIAVPKADKTIYEAKLLGFAKDDRVRLCQTCYQRAVEDDMLIFSCVLPPLPTVEQPEEARD